MVENLIKEEPLEEKDEEQGGSEFKASLVVWGDEDPTDDEFDGNGDDYSLELATIPPESVRRSTRLINSVKYESEDEEYQSSESDSAESVSEDGDNDSDSSWSGEDVNLKNNAAKSAKKHHISATIKFTPNKSGKYPCPHGKACAKTFAHKKSCTRHFQVTHTASSSVVCPTCSKSFTRQDHLLNHRRSVHGEDIPTRGGGNGGKPTHQKKDRKRYPCPVCSIPLLKTELGPHVDEHGDPTPYSCSECPLSFATSKLLSRHKDVHYIRKKAICTVCGHIFRDIYHLSVHQINVHHVRIDKVKVKDIKEMAKSGDMPKPYSCHVCPKSYPRKDKLTEHLLCHGIGEKLKCGICKAEFNYKKSLTRHELTHTDPEYKCPQEECVTEFTRKGHLVEHLKAVHGVEISYAELVKAERGNGNVPNLRKGPKKNKKILKDKTVACEVCKKMVPRKRLKLHAVVHTGEKTHLCDICGRSFSLHESLVVHRNYVHGFKKALTCDECGVTCKRPKDLRAHKRIIHELPNDHRPYQCSQCGKSFKWGKNLRDHEALHRGDGQCVCDTCGKVFTRPDNLRAHTRTVHEGHERRRKKVRVAEKKDSHQRMGGGTSRWT